ncbi:RidA family protein [Mycobacterium sp. NPDC048908]|uniref:RidA family protein n=1 Tax=Mycobacterium sp. NPDC048908 TaxID=3364292 RepID=UPI0037157256
MSTADTLAALGLELPPVPVPVANYVPARVHGNLVFSSGQTPTRAGELLMKGKLGRDFTVEQGQEAARLSILNCLAALSAELGSLDAIDSIVKLTGFVASAEGFEDQPAVINGASLLLEQVFGERGRHARSALGVAELPYGAPVEVELIVSTKPGP